ncbi:hypothetical protein cyc_04404 [Cyclospora cayetanensis]|uniref:Uncharacterized protein n=1 Tax=Cyclospora cayetanensis TaxID=88456 RepID=A0A1D3CSM5_9EIME|nr:hypothetical protein cyc_04404 [Cyclospora cayetanensis]
MASLDTVLTGSAAQRAAREELMQQEQSSQPPILDMGVGVVAMRVLALGVLTLSRRFESECDGEFSYTDQVRGGSCVSRMQRETQQTNITKPKLNLKGRPPPPKRLSGKPATWDAVSLGNAALQRGQSALQGNSGMSSRPLASEGSTQRERSGAPTWCLKIRRIFSYKQKLEECGSLKACLLVLSAVNGGGPLISGVKSEGKIGSLLDHVRVLDQRQRLPVRPPANLRTRYRVGGHGLANRLTAAALPL